MKEFKRNQRNEYLGLFKRHLIAAVLSRIDFRPLFSFNNLVGQFQKEFSNDFPISKIGNNLGYDIDISNAKDPQISVNDDAVKTYELINNDEKKQTKFSNTSLILEYYHYIEFESFKQTFSKLLNFIYEKESDVIKPNRLGLRKINQFILEESENGVANFKNYFNKSLIEHLGIPFVNQTIDRDRHFMRFQMENNLQVNFQYGTDLGNDSENRARRFILDIDVYTLSIPNKCNEIIAMLEVMNGLLFDIFLWSIEDTMIKHLKK